VSSGASVALFTSVQWQNQMGLDLFDSALFYSSITLLVGPIDIFQAYRTDFLAMTKQKQEIKYFLTLL
jgi:hypothetical protein